MNRAHVNVNYWVTNLLRSRWPIAAHHVGFRPQDGRYLEHRHQRITPLPRLLTRLVWQRDPNLWTVRCRNGTDVAHAS